MIVRGERPEDAAEIARVVEAAFDKAAIATFAEEIRASRSYVPELAFVGEDETGIVAHVMLSRVWVEPVGAAILILTPMSVRPDRQRQGLGSALLEAALGAADAMGEPLVTVIGVPAYYPRFGFRSARALGLDCPDPTVPDEAWMALPLQTYDESIRGRVTYAPHFPEPPSA